MPVVGPVVGFFGSRRLPASASRLVASVVGSVVAAGRRVAVGCALGGDALALAAALPLLCSVSSSSAPSLFVFAAFGPGGVGSWRWSAVGLVSLASRFGAPGSGVWRPVSVSWWAGGRGSLRSRLRGRSAALVRFVARGGPGSGLVGFVSGGWSASPGSWSSVRLALAAGLPVVVFPRGCSVSCFPSFFPGVGRVRWVPAASSGVWASGFRAVVVGASGASAPGAPVQKQESEVSNVC